MANLTEIEQWEAGIYQLETTDVVEGGETGIDNLQPRQLANRTSWLKAQLLALGNLLGVHEAAADPHPQYMVPAEAQANAMRTGTAGGTADAITAVFAPVVAALTSGMILCLRAASANATTTPTFTPGAGVIAAKTIVKGNGVALVAGDIAGAGYWFELQYDATLDKWILLNPATGMATVTATNDATFADNGVKPASTSWVRGAMAVIATAAGFAVSLASNGYIKFPSWLGGWIVQWATSGSVGAGSTGSITWPIVFPTVCLWGLAAPLGSAASPTPQNVVAGTSSVTSMTLYNWGTIASPAKCIAFGY